ncbi:MAG: phytase, partial [Bacteroidota bacterium]
DSLALVAAYDAQAKILLEAFPAGETDPVSAAEGEDAADDPAVWVHPTQPEKSVIFGSNKKGGIVAYDLQGSELAFYPFGNVNNVDILYDFPWGDSSLTLIGYSNRSNQSIDIQSIGANGELMAISGGQFSVDRAKIDDVYGFCFGYDQHSQTHFAIVNGKNGMMQQFAISMEGDSLQFALVREYQFASQTEGMVVDAEMGFLYVGEENLGIWRLPLSPNDTSAAFLLVQSGIDNKAIDFDIEGLSIYESASEGYLFASSQGNFSYAVFRRNPPNEYVTSFKISGNDEVDGVEETDGLALISDSLGETFPAGIMVVQDGFNYAGDSLVPQNFKIIDWRQIEALLSAQ